MAEYFDIYGTRIPVDSIKDFRIIEVEFIFRPMYHEIKKTMISALSGKKFEFVAMQPYAAIIGQQGQKSALGEYKAKDFKEALGKDLSGAVIYTIADKLKLKAFKHQKYQCLNLAGRAFTTYLDDVPVMLTWNDGRIAEVNKEDPLYASLGESTTPGIQYVPALLIKANENYCFYGNGIQLIDASYEYTRLMSVMEEHKNQKSQRRIGGKGKQALPQLPKFHLPTKTTAQKEPDIVKSVDTFEVK